MCIYKVVLFLNDIIPVILARTHTHTHTLICLFDAAALYSNPYMNMPPNISYKQIRASQNTLSCQQLPNEDTLSNN